MFLRNSGGRFLSKLINFIKSENHKAKAGEQMKLDHKYGPLIRVKNFFEITLDMAVSQCYHDHS